MKISKEILFSGFTAMCAESSPLQVGTNYTFQLKTKINSNRINND